MARPSRAARRPSPARSSPEQSTARAPESSAESAPQQAAPTQLPGRPFDVQPPPEMQRAVIEQMQQTLGNRGLIRVMQRQPAPAPATPTPAPAIPEDLQRFRDAGPLPADAAGTTVLPSTGRGGFQARYDPVGMTLTITLNVKVNFIDGMTNTGGTAVAADPSLNNAANQLNALPAADRAAAIASWQWGTDKEAWMSEFRGTVASAWGTSGHGMQFESSKAGWESQRARVNVVVNTQDATVDAATAATGTSTIPGTAGPTHCTANIYKTPLGNNDFGANVAPGTTTSATDQTLNLSSSQTVTHGHLLSQPVFFDHGKSTLNAAAKTRLISVMKSFQPPSGAAGTTIDIIGHSDTSGAKTAKGKAFNQKVSEKRAQAVADFLKGTHGGVSLANAATRITSTTGAGSFNSSLHELLYDAGLAKETGAEARRVDVNFAGGGKQNTAVHEFGHMLGMRDEYAVDPGGVIGGSAGTTGTATDQDPSVSGTGLGRSIKENNDNIMSLGNTMRPPHMVMFMEALRNVTSSTEWRIKP